MAVSKRTTFKDEIQHAVMNALLSQSHTTRELADLTGYNYYSIRNVLHEYEDQGVIKRRGYRRNASVWSLIRDTDTITPNNSIPSTTGNAGLPLKVTAILNYVGKEDSMTSLQAAKNLPMLLARILMTSLRVAKYPNNVEATGNHQTLLDNLKLEMENNLKSLETTVKLYKTILDSKVLWDADFIKVVPHDVDFDEVQVTSAYKHYFPDS